MLITLFISFTISLALSIYLISTPILLGLWILLLALSISLTISIFLRRWLSLFIFIIYIGGILVIFAYFIALSPNQFISINILIPFILTVSFSAIYLTFITSFSFPSNSFITTSSQPVIPYLLQIFNLPMLILLALILFFALVAVVKISSLTLGPLRPFNIYVQTHS